jgi:hypothetical protein
VVPGGANRTESVQVGATKVKPNPSIERTATGLAREAPQVIVPLRGPIRRPPLMSNVRQHRNVCALPSLHRAAGGKFKCARAVTAKLKRVRALGGVALNLSQTSSTVQPRARTRTRAWARCSRRAVREGLLGPPVILRAARHSLFTFASAARLLLLVLGALARLEQTGRKHRRVCSKLP